MIIEYSVVTSDMLDDLEKLINEKLKEGWEPYRDLQILNNLWRQVIIKREIPVERALPSGRMIKVE